MRDNKKQEKKKKSVDGWFYGIFNGQTSSETYCTPDQCFVNNHQTFSSTNLISPDASHHIESHNSTIISDIVNFIKFSELFPSELVQLITDAAQKGLLLSMLITLANEGATDYLKSLHYNPDNIYWINQGIRALLLIALGT